MIQPTLDEAFNEPHLVVSNQYRVCAECDQDIDKGDKYGRSANGDVLCEICAPEFALMDDGCDDSGDRDED